VTRSLMVPLGRVGLGVAVVTAAAVLSGCSFAGNPASSVPPSNPLSASAAPSVSPAAVTPPVIVGVTTAGALVTLNPTTGVAEQTLVPSGVVGEGLSVAPGGMVFFTIKNGCGSTIEEIPAGGGSAVLIAPGSAPAVSPDGTKLAYASQPQYGSPPDCQVSSPDLDEWFQLKIRTLSSGATVTLAALPAGQGTGLPHPISHLSWSADNNHLAVSISPAEDNDGYQVNLVNTAEAHYFVAGTGVVTVPVVGSPDHLGTVLGEADYLPDGDLFVDRFCCEGTPGSSLSSLLWEVTTSGAFVHQVAIGDAAYGHSNLDSTSDGRWLLYVAHTVDAATLYVSQGGATPRALTTGIFAAAWS
jgi:WD40-like Beta Propeller Repeat